MSDRHIRDLFSDIWSLTDSSPKALEGKASPIDITASGLCDQDLEPSQIPTRQREAPTFSWGSTPNSLLTRGNLSSHETVNFNSSSPAEENYHSPETAGKWFQRPSSASPGQPTSLDQSNALSQTSFIENHSRQPGLPRRRSRYMRHRGSTTCSTSPSVATPSSDLDPMQRWRNSPPEVEPASMSAIAKALQQSSRHDRIASSSSKRSASTYSFGSSTSQSTRSVTSNRSSRSGFTQDSTPISKKRPARIRRGRQNDSGRIFQCTFCCDKFRVKHDWARHESCLHLSLDQWVCAPFGGVVTSPMTGQNHCLYCNMENPLKEHLDEHHHDACRGSPEPHIFRRKDHLVQHLRGFHGLETLPNIEKWKLEPPLITSRCGFCNARLSSWKERVDHLAEHFRQGSTIHEWRGDHGFEPSIAAQVTNALPPYLLSDEARSPMPFSATDPSYRVHLSQIYQDHDHAPDPPDSQEPTTQTTTTNSPPLELNPNTYASYLALHLGRFAQRSIANGIFPTDQMFQDESRRLHYGNDDGWNFTMADNDEWLTSFRANHLGVPK